MFLHVPHFCHHFKVLRATRLLPSKRCFDVTASVFELTSLGFYAVGEEDGTGGGGDSELDSEVPKLDKS